MTASRIRVALFLVLSIFGMLLIPDLANRWLSVELVPSGALFLIINRAGYALLIAALAIFLLRGTANRLAILVIALVAIVIPLLVAMITLSITAGPAWEEKGWVAGITIFAELTVFALIPFGFWLSWRRVEKGAGTRRPSARR